MKSLSRAAILPMLLTACAEPYETASCGTLPEVAIDGFTVKLSTGSDGSNADIFFCVLTAAGDDCEEMATSGNDFQENTTQEFDLGLSVAAGALTGFYVENRGGGDLGDPLLDLITAGTDWDLVAITVTAQLDDGSTARIYDEPDITNGHLEGNERWSPLACAY